MAKATRPELLRSTRRSYYVYEGQILTVVARDHNKGLLLAGKGFKATWVDDLMMATLLAKGVLS